MFARSLQMFFSYLVQQNISEKLLVIEKTREPSQIPGIFNRSGRRFELDTTGMNRVPALN